MSAAGATGSTGGNKAGSQSSPKGQHVLTSSQQEALKRVTKIIDSFVLRNDCAPFLEPVDWRGLELYDYPTIIKKPMDLGTIKRKLERNQYQSAAYCVADVRRVWDNCMVYNSVGSDFYLLAKNCSKRFEDRYRRIRNEYDIGEEPPKSDVEDDDGDEENQIDNEMGTTRRGQERDGDEEEGDDEENEFQDNDGEDMEEEEEEEEEEDDEDEMEAKSSDATGSPASSSHNKRQRTNTPPPSSHLSLSFDVKVQFTTNLLYLNGTDLGHVMSLLEQHCPSVLETYDNHKSTGQSSSDDCKMLQVPECMEINVDVLMEEFYNVYTMIKQYCQDHTVKKRFIAAQQSSTAIKIKDISNKRKERKS